MRPEWITDRLSEFSFVVMISFVCYCWIVSFFSIKENQLLPEINYQLYAKDVNNIKNYVSEMQPSTSVEGKPKTIRFAAPDAKDPNFIRDYYAQSRLHMISTWGQEMKQFTKELKQSSDQSFPGRQLVIEHLNESGTVGRTDKLKGNVIMHLDMDCFFVSVGLRERPSLKGQPVAVTHSKGKGPTAEFVSSSEIASCSYEARRVGVTNGMWLGEALKLCPDIKTIPYDFEKYKTVSKELYEIVAK